MSSVSGIYFMEKTHGTKKNQECQVIFFQLVHDNFETKYELMIMVKEVVVLVVLVHKVLDSDYSDRFDVNARFANQLIFVVARNE